MKTRLLITALCLLALPVQAKDIAQWATSAADNNDAAPDGFPENMAPSGVNDAAREVMAAIARRVTDEAFTIRSDGDSANNLYRITPSQTISAYATGQVFAFIADFLNTGTASISVSSLATAEIVKRNDQGLARGDIEADQHVMIAYDASAGRFQMLTPQARPAMFESSEQTITAAGALTLAHSLGVTPDYFAAYLVNQIASLGYLPGAPVAINIGASAGSNRGMAVTADNLNVYIRYGSAASTFQILNATSGATSNITNTNWRLVIKAFN